MSVVLKWPVQKWETKAKLWCKLFGHRWESGWYGDRPYLKPKGGPVDNLNTHHPRLTCECWHCGTVSTIAYIHTDLDNKLFIK